MELNQLFMTLGDLDDFPVYLQVGRLYVPFGNLGSFFITDPIVLEMSEGLKDGAILGFEQDGFSASLSVFESNVRGTDDYNGVLATSYRTEDEDGFLGFGGALIKNILDADGLTGTLEDLSYVSADEAAGLNFWLTAGKGRAILIAEYVQTLEVLEIKGVGAGLRPAALNLELGIMLTEGVDVVARIERSIDETDWFAQSRYGVACNCVLFEQGLVAVCVALEYMCEKYDDGSAADLFAIQFAAEF
jgi:hypothetical protein